MGYHESDSHVRADLFKPSGKWKYNLALDMGNFYDETLIHDAIIHAMDEHLHWGSRWRSLMASGYWLVVLKPFHPHSHPIVINKNVLDYTNMRGSNA